MQGDSVTTPPLQVRAVALAAKRPLVEKIYLLASGGVGDSSQDCERLVVDSLYGNWTMQRIAQKSATPYTLLVIHDTTIEFGQVALERLLAVAELTGSGMVYSDYNDLQGGQRVSHAVPRGVRFSGPLCRHHGVASRQAFFARLKQKGQGTPRLR